MTQYIKTLMTSFRGCQDATTPGSSHGQVVLHNPITSLNPLGYSMLSRDVSPLHCSGKATFTV